MAKFQTDRFRTFDENRARKRYKEITPRRPYITSPLLRSSRQTRQRQLYHSRINHCMQARNRQTRIVNTGNDLRLYYKGFLELERTGLNGSYLILQMIQCNCSLNIIISNLIPCIAISNTIMAMYTRVKSNTFYVTEILS